MNDIRLRNILRSRAKAIKGCVVTEHFGESVDTPSFRVEADTGAIFVVRVSVYKDAIQ